MHNDDDDDDKYDAYRRTRRVKRGGTKGKDKGGEEIRDDISLHYVGIKGNVFSVLSGYTIMNQTLRLIIEMDSY